MSDSAPASQPEPTPFDKFKDFARRIIAVPKAEADAKDREWRDDRAKATERKKSADPR